ncbi:MAG: alpha-glucan family phosphorylase [Bacteroidales bacterium]|nr:alpha-glucan family phosphorylase [Bacteroidales bacterium]
MGANLNQSKHNTPLWKGMVVQSSFPQELKELNTLATNLWWTWNYEVKDLFQEIDSVLWKKSLNPIQVLKEISYDRLVELTKNDSFMQQYKAVLQKYNDYMAVKPAEENARIGYFSMEYGLDDSLKVFSGGLGILAGDYLKEASDTNTNMVAVGFLYKFGYFQQKLSLDGDQMAVYTPQNPSELPVHLVTDSNNNPITVQVGLPGRIINAQIWLVHVGRIKLYLLDTDISDNNEEDRAISHALYGGNNEHRLKQEMLLGIGGVRTLEAVGEKIDIFHCNEGHAAFINLERLRKLIKHKNFSFQKALEVVRSSTLYTTHTPVPAGHDSFPEDLMMTYLGQFPERLQLSWNDFMNLGRMYPDNHGENFSMSNLAICTSQEVNGVSRLHGDVSKKMFNDLWQGYQVEESHIGYVTNGVHYGTWISKDWQNLHNKTFGAGFLNNLSDSSYWSKIYDVNDEVLWNIKEKHREKLISYVKEKLHENWTQRFEDPKRLVKITQSISSKTLTIGFARRFATYKRAYLLFSNLERLSKIVNNPERPIQFIFAGKAHPNDKPGQAMIKEIVRISKLSEFVGKIIFMENYDMNLARQLVQGVDIWLNTPTRPLEASGTSGMKAVMNGAMNFSVLDGWWCEGYKEGAGWALPEKRTYDDQEFQNKLDAETIYSMLENEIAPLYYNRDKDGIPHQWIQYMKKCIAEIAPEFTTKRMIDDYHERYYSKLADRKKQMTANNYELADEITEWKKKISEKWDDIYVISTDIEKSADTLTLGKSYEGEVKLDLKGLSPDEIGVELVLTEQDSSGEFIVIEKTPFKFLENDEHISIFSISITPKKSGVFNYGIRMYPKHHAIPHRQDFAYVRWL